MIEGNVFTEVKLMRRTCDDWSELRRERFEGFALRRKMGSSKCGTSCGCIKMILCLSK